MKERCSDRDEMFLAQCSSCLPFHWDAGLQAGGKGVEVEVHPGLPACFLLI